MSVLNIQDYGSAPAPSGGGTAADTVLTPTGSVTATNVQDAIAELDAKKVATNRIGYSWQVEGTSVLLSGTAAIPTKDTLDSAVSNARGTYGLFGTNGSNDWTGLYASQNIVMTSLPSVENVFELKYPSNTRLWSGLLSGTAAFGQSPTNWVLAFTYDAAIDTPYLHIYTSDWNGHQVRIATTTPVQANRRYVCKVEVRSASLVEFSMDGAVVYSATTNLPVFADAAFRPTCVTETALASESYADFLWSKTYVEHN